METVKIDVKSIPQEVWDAGCAVLDGVVRRLFADEEVRKDFEKWKEEREKWNSVKETN